MDVTGRGLLAWRVATWPVRAVWRKPVGMLALPVAVIPWATIVNSACKDGCLSEGELIAVLIVLLCVQIFALVVFIASQFPRRESKGAEGRNPNHRVATQQCVSVFQPAQPVKDCWKRIEPGALAPQWTIHKGDLLIWNGSEYAPYGRFSVNGSPPRKGEFTCTGSVVYTGNIYTSGVYTSTSEHLHSAATKEETPKQACVAVLTEGAEGLVARWNRPGLVSFAKLHALGARPLSAWTLKGRFDIGYAHGFEVRVLDDRHALWCRLVVTQPIAWKLIEKASKLHVRAIGATQPVELFVDVESTDIPGTLREREGRLHPLAERPARAANLLPITREQIEFVPAEPEAKT